MCGITGFVSDSAHAGVDERLIERMCRSLAHRGPDDWGMAVGARPESPLAGDAHPRLRRFPASRPVALGNTRLSVVDLSAEGHQPMVSADQQTWIAYNGEVYNFRELRESLIARGCRFRSGTDTEVVLQLFEREGPACFARLNGMFALAIWDGRRQELVLARDRFGVKPLYYAHALGGIVFASEMQTLLGAGVPSSLDVNAVHAYLSFLSVPEPDTIVTGIKKVPPGSFMRIGANGVDVQAFWRLDVHSDWEGGEADAAAAVREHLTRAVSRQTFADVPVGAFLSGGVDSSAIVSLMVQSGRPPACVHSIGFGARDRRYERVADDLGFATQLAGDLNLPQHTTILEAPDRDLLPKLVRYLDEPIADPAIIPTYQICAAARQYTKVLLSGMGADELFAGYRRHSTSQLLAQYGRLPAAARQVIAAGVRALPSAGAMPFSTSVRHAQKLMRIARDSSSESYVQACTWIDPSAKDALYSPSLRAAVNGSQAERRHRATMAEVDSSDPVTRMLYLDTRLYLPSHNLNYTDKMSMAASVEVRVPFLDNDLVDLAFRLPASLKLKGRERKFILKKALAGVVSPAILQRPKTGFAAPIRSWLVNDLRELTRDLLSPARLRARGLFDPDAVTAMLTAQQQGRHDYSHTLWALLTLELWTQAYRN